MEFDEFVNSIEDVKNTMVSYVEEQEGRKCDGSWNIDIQLGVDSFAIMVSSPSLQHDYNREFSVQEDHVCKHLWLGTERRRNDKTAEWQ